MSTFLSYTFDNVIEGVYINVDVPLLPSSDPCIFGPWCESPHPSHHLIKIHHIKGTVSPDFFKII